MAEMETVQDNIETLDAWSLDHLVDIAKGALNVPPDDADVGSLSGGERRRVALCRLLLESPDVLLLDEPTNHLDAESVRWLEEYLAAYKGTVLAITHDRYFLNQVAGWILEVDRGNLYAYSGNYSTWLEKKQSRMDLESKSDARRAKAMQEELEWIRQVSRSMGSTLRSGQWTMMPFLLLSTVVADVALAAMRRAPRAGSESPRPASRPSSQPRATTPNSWLSGGSSPEPSPSLPPRALARLL